MSPELIPKKLLHDRALMLSRARAFFAEKSVMEVDCCALRPHAALDANIDAIASAVAEAQTGFLHTSPEYTMKRLIASGSGDIYYLGHVFRKGDIGRIHSPEFTMAEWYRIGISLADLIQETCDFLCLFLGTLPLRKVSYRDAFLHYAGIDCINAPLFHLREQARKEANMDTSSWDRDTCLHFLLAHQVEPNLGHGALTALIDYPPHEAALACIIENQGEKTAERFEIYHRGIELANGYHELSDPEELRSRLREENRKRGAQNKEIYPLDEQFLSALDNHFPNCCGVSVGVDRALMLRHQVETIAEVLPFAWAVHP
ncbi:MAG: EF-P lysine aminoacylase GenX [Chlamydiia bacterium]|nr:EF-P lysine aminoacylase GenX [Chlamydiia bacterium]